MADYIQLSNGNNNALPLAVEYGSNTNGQYIKFSDGSLICFAVVSKSSGNTVTFPYTFYAAPIVHVAVTDSNSNNMFEARPETRSASSFKLHAVRLTSGGSVGEFTTATNYSYIAIGRWKAA